MTGEDHYQPAPNDGDQIKHRVVAKLAAARLDIAAACTAADCRVEALLGDGDLTFEEAVSLANLLGCSPTAFFEASDTPLDTPPVPDGKSKAPTS